MVFTSSIYIVDGLPFFSIFQAHKIFVSDDIKERAIKKTPLVKYERTKKAERSLMYFAVF
jgi:hypothetical protein